MTPIRNRAIFPDAGPEQARQATPARTSNRSAPPAPLPCASHPFAVRVQSLMAGGKTKAAALREAIEKAPADHESWLRAVQRHGQ